MGKKGCIAVGQLADLVVPDRDYFACPESDIADTTALMTIVGGKVVYASGPFAEYDEGAVPPAMPDWSPVRIFGGYANWGESGKPLQAGMRERAALCGCASSCSVHGHAHVKAWASASPVTDLKGFWGALGCACWAV